MLIYLFIIFGVIIAAAIGAGVWFIFRAKRPMRTEKRVDETIKPERLPFRFAYILLPLIVLFITVALSAYFYPKLPEEVAIQLRFDEEAGRWLSRGLTMVLAIAPQAFLTALGTGVILLLTRLGVISPKSWSLSIRPERILWFLGNLTAIPQGVLCFTMFSVFYYNVYQVPIMSTWLFLIVSLGISGAILGLFLVFMFIKMRQKLQPQETESIDNARE